MSPPPIAARPGARALTRVGTLVDGGTVGAWSLGFLLVGYLALKGGGFDAVVRSEVGVAVWWLLLLGAATGVLTIRRPDRWTWAVLGLFAGLFAWTAIGIAWSESVEATLSGAARLSLYLGVLVLAIAVAARGRGAAVINGVACAIAGACALSALSRLHPAWFPVDDTARLLPSLSARTSYPLGYWNAVAAMVALGLPMLVQMSVTARTVATRSLAVAATPLLILTWYFTLSRGGAVAIAAGLLALVALSPQRLRLLRTLALGGGGGALLIAALEQRQALADNLGTALAHHQGNELSAVVLVVCGGVGLVQAAFALLDDRGSFPAVPAPGRRVTALAAIGLIAVALGAGAPHRLSTAWTDFKTPTDLTALSDTSQRFSSVGGNGRYQYWVSAVDAAKAKPLQGTGAGTFKLWWDRHATLPGTIRNAHSLYFETLAETGFPGLALLLGLIGGLLVAAVARVRRARGARREVFAGATAALVAFFVSASVDWVWQVTVLPVAMLLLAGALLADRSSPRKGATSWTLRAGLAAVAVLALVALAIPLSGTVHLRESQAAARHGNLQQALGDAGSAGRVQPYAVSPPLQQALVLELAGQLDDAVAAARTAAAKEPTNWQPQYVLARLEGERGHAAAAVRAYRRAKALNQTGTVP